MIILHWSNIFIDKMNERDMEFLTAAFTKYYGRLGQATIDVL